MEDVERTIISQYANSPTLVQLIQNMNGYIDQRANFQAFYDYVWNVNTAVGFGLDIWGKIVNISRLLRVPNVQQNFGFKNTQTPPDFTPWNNAPWNTPGNAQTQTYLLPDDAYRILILTKALSNIAATTSPSINQLLRNLFPGRGRAYVLDLGNMAMQFTFEFQLTAVEYAILAQSGALPHPAGVETFIKVVPASGLFGFAQAAPTSQTFGHGLFYSPPG